MPPSDFCPYIGLQPYSEADRDYFFGRETDVRIIASNLYASPFTVLYGATGVGKSSLLRAGVVPYLRGRQRTAVVVFNRWQDEAFLSALKSECLAAVAAVSAKPVAIAADLPLDEFLFEAAAILGGPILILFDQFEEFLLYHPGRQTGDPFEAQLARAVNREEVDANFLIALREDWLSGLNRYRARIPNLLGNTIHLRHLTVAAAEGAIRKPLEVYNSRLSPATPPVRIEDELVRSVLSQVRTGRVIFAESAGTGRALGHDEEQYVEAAFLQLVMTRIWNEELLHGSRTLRQATLERLGGAEQIITRHLADVMDNLSAEEREICARIFQYLVTPTGAKIAQKTADLIALADYPAERVKPLLEGLTGKRILSRIDQPERYQIFHDVLAQSILDWRTRFQRAKASEEAERQAAEQRRRAEREAAAARRLRRLAASLAVMVLLAAAAAVIAWMQRQKALANERLSRSRELAIAAVQNVEQDDPERGQLLAMFAVKATDPPTLEAENALHRALQESRVRLRLTGHSGAVTKVAFSPDGKQLATASRDKTVRTWDAVSGKPLVTLIGHAGSVTDVVFSPDGTRLATASDDGTARVWDAATGKESLRLAGLKAKVARVAFSPDGRLLAAALGNGAGVWDASSGKQALRLTGHIEAVNCVTFSMDGKRLATASNDGTGKVWDPATGRNLITLVGHSDAVLDIAFDRHGARLATAGADGTARLWDAATGEQVRLLSAIRTEPPGEFGHTTAVERVAFSSDGKKLATGSTDRTARVWDAETGAELLVLRGHTDFVSSVAFSPDDKRLATASIDTTARVWDIEASEELLTISPQRGALSRVVFSPDGKRIASSALDGTTAIWDAGSGTLLADLPGHRRGVSVTFSPDGKLVATASLDQTVTIWDSRSGNDLILKYSKSLTDVAFSPDGRQVATASWDPALIIWDTASGRRLLNLTGHEVEVYSVRFSPDGEHIATGGGDRTARIWDARSGRQLLKLEHPLRVYGVSFSPDARRLATAGEDGKVRIWDVASGALLQTLSGHTDWVHGVAFSPDGIKLASAGRDGTVRVWDSATGKELLTLSAHRGMVYGVSISPDGTRLASAGADGTIRVYALRIEDLMKLAQTRITRALTSDECARYLHTEECPPPP